MKSVCNEREIGPSTSEIQLVHTLMTLLEQHPFQDITVNQICTKAQISRSTFYTYFEDKHHLLHYTFASLNGKLLQSRPPGRDSYLMQVVEFISNYPAAARNLFRTGENAELEELFCTLIAAQQIQVLEQRRQAGELFTLPVEQLATFLAGGYSSLILWWIRNNYPLSKHEMLAALERLGCFRLYEPERRPVINQ